MKLHCQELFRSQCFVDNTWVDAPDGARLRVLNPATNEEIGSVPRFGKAETARAIDAAAHAWPAWRALTAGARSRLLRSWFELIVEHHQDLAMIMTLEQGKPLDEAKGEVLHGADYVEWYAEEAKRVYGETIPAPQTDKRILVLKQPVGVCAAITPWNFPSSMITRKAAPALAAGCTVVIKPSSKTPLSALALAWLAEQAGFPAGVLNIITGQAKEIGQEMTANPLVRKLSFTGSTAVGKLLMRDCAPTIKKLSLELGGHAPFIVCADADVDEAVRGAMACKYRNSGQTCVCANRFIVHTSIYEQFAEKLVAAVGQLRVGNGFEAGVQQGPLIDQGAVHKVQGQVEDAVAKGARVACGGSPLAGEGCFFAPTVLLDIAPGMRIAHDETFGPVAPLFPFTEEHEAITLANNTPYGLASYLYSRDIGRIWRMAEALEYGIVGINTGRTSSEAAPFGGVKESGIGREGSWYGLEEYLELKYLCLGGLDSPTVG